MRVGLVYDLFEAYPWRPGEPDDADAEYEPEETVQVIEEALRALGHTPVRIGTPHDLLQQLPNLAIDAAVNIAEGAHSRNREGYAPVLLEMAGIPFLGSDALTLSVSLDKAWTKDLARAAGVPTPAYATFSSVAALEGGGFPSTFPLFVKPRYEGSAKGITARSRVETPDALRREVDRVTSLYRQDALVETFVEGGGEFTVAIVGNDPPEALPVLQRAVETNTGIGLHALEGSADVRFDYCLEGDLTPELESELQRLAILIYEKLACRDFARVDFRADGAGRPFFLEINPLPTFAPDGTFAVLAELMGRPYGQFLADVLARGFSRVAAAADEVPA